MHYFCTYFDSHYLTRGLALYRSLTRHAAPFRLWVLCFDSSAYSSLKKLALPEIVPILLEDFEKDDAGLLKAKENRSKVEYYFTCTPSLPLYIFKNYPEVDLITYLDADLFFFSSPAQLYQEIKDNSILIIGHRFPSHLHYYSEKTGIYNVGWVSFRRDEHAFSCLHWWREQCIRWCYERFEDGKFADQKYLDDWPQRFDNVKVSRCSGANLALWNFAGFKIDKKNGDIYVDDQPLIFYHFTRLEQKWEWLYNPNLTAYGVQVNSVLKYHIYGPYIEELYKTRKWLASKRVTNRALIHMNTAQFDNNYAEPDKHGTIYKLAGKIRYVLSIVKGILRGYLWVAICGKLVKLNNK